MERTGKTYFDVKMLPDVKVDVGTLRVFEVKYTAGAFKKGASFVIGFIPVAGDLKDLQEALTGVDYVIMEKLSGGQRIITGICVLLPIANGKAARQVTQEFGEKIGRECLCDSGQSIRLYFASKGASNLDDGLGTYAKQGGHHPMAKKAFEGVEGYNARSALTISQSKLSKFGVTHSTITGQQHSLYKAFGKTGQSLTMDAMKQIENKAMTNSGVPLDYATNAVEKAIQELLDSGVTQPTRIPWGK